MAQDDYIRTALRVPPELHRALHEAADKSSKSFNAEIIERLQRSYEDDRASKQREGMEVAVIGVQSMLAFHLCKFFDLLPEEERAKAENQVVRNMAKAIGHGKLKEIHDSLSAYFRWDESLGMNRLAETLHDRRKILDARVGAELSKAAAELIKEEKKTRQPKGDSKMSKPQPKPDES